MKKILLRLFAVIGLLTTLSACVSGLLFWHWLSGSEAAPKEPDSVVLSLDFTQPIVEQSRGLNFSLGALLSDEEDVPLLSMIRAIDRAKTDPHVKGIFARFGALQPSMAHAQELRAALARFRESGKFTYAFAPNYGDFGGGNKAYYLASAFENIWLQPVGVVGLTGLGVEAPFGKGFFDKIGVGTDFVRRAEYKSVMENATNDAFSPPVRANMESLIGDLLRQEKSGIAESRQMDEAKVGELLAAGPFTSDEALAKGLVTRTGYWDEVTQEIKDKAGKDVVEADAPTYLAFDAPAAKKKGKKKADKPKATVALITAEGLITDDPESPMRYADDAVIDTDKIAGAFDDAADDDQVNAILFRVNSPGGSPSASETIRRALVKAKESKKPVFVSMGEVAASGGYWIAMNADRIFAEPGTITGSIGVVGGKFTIGGLSEKLGVTWDKITTSPNAGIWSPTASFTPEQLARVNALMDDTYGAFTKNVAEARKIPLDKIGDVAKGRVFTGAQAKEAGLVDDLGGFAATILALKKQLNLQPTDKVALVRFPAPESPTSLIYKILKNLGLQSLNLQGSLGSWQKLQTLAAPLLKAAPDLAPQSPIAASLPSAYAKLAQ